MKRILSAIIIAAAAFVIAGCESFSTSYQRIDADEFRMLDFIYEPTDAAPGDSVTLTAVFAGKALDIDNDLEWWISFNVIHDFFFGNETVVDSVRLEPLAPRVTHPEWPSDKTQSVSFRIKIPDDIMNTSAAIPEMWIDMLPTQSMRDAVPDELASLTKHDVIEMIENLPNENLDESAAAPLRALLQWFTVPFRISVKHNSGKFPHTIKSTNFVRYNNRYPAWAPINNNPVIDEVVMYKVKGSDVTHFDDKSGLEYDSTALDKTGYNEIVIEKDYSYFLSAITLNPDSTWTMDGNRIAERHRIYRHFQLDANEAASVDHSKYMIIDNSNGKITPPTDRRIEHITFWLTVYDEALNERMRPQGSTLAEVTARFVYR